MQLAKLPDWRMQVHKTVQRSPRLDRALYDFRRRRSPAKFKEGYIQAALESMPGDAHLYLEVGVYKGGSFHLIAAQRKVGVDPNPLLDMSKLSGTEVVVAQESDRFFASPQADELLGGGVSVALIDGLHEFGQAWRDVANAALHMRANGLIVLDDCNPLNELAAADVRDSTTWNGDVWKVIAMIRATQPQWRCLTVDADQGVGLIWGFDQPMNPISQDELSYFKGMPYESLERDRAGCIGLTPVRYLPQDVGFSVA